MDTNLNNLLDHFSDLTPLQKVAAQWRLDWLLQAHRFQILPPGENWNIWLLLAGRGSGKGLTLTTPIPTTTGWKTMEELCAGDQLFDENGQICTVIEAHEPYEPKQLFELTFSDGATIQADGEHLWTIWTFYECQQYLTHQKSDLFPKCWGNYRFPFFSTSKRATAKQRHTVKPQTTEELLKIIYKPQKKRTDPNLNIPCTLALELSEVFLPLDPWLLGVWLANGKTGTNTVVINKILSTPYSNPVRKKLHDLKMLSYEKIVHENIYFYIDQLATTLAQLGVLQEKQIPNLYLRASKAQRLALLHGLCAVNHYPEEDNLQFICTSELLANHVCELICTLGERANLTKKILPNSATPHPSYIVKWYQTINEPLKVPKKFLAQTFDQYESLRLRYRMILNIKHIPAQTVRCITVDSPRGLYLASPAFIPTHNTKCASNNIAWLAWNDPQARIAVIAPTANDLRFTCFEGNSGLLETIPPELIKTYNKSIHELVLQNGALLRGISADSYERLRGPNWSAGWLDELAAYEYVQECYDMYMFGLRLGKRPITIITTTPKPRELLFNLVKREGKDVIIDRATSYDNLSNLAPTFKEQIIQYEGTKLGRQEIHAELIDPFEAGIIKKQWIQKWPANKALPPLDYVVVSLDTAFTEKTVDKETYDRDPTACTVWGIWHDGQEKQANKRKKILLLDCWDDYLGLPELIKRAKKELLTAYGSPLEPKIKLPKMHYPSEKPMIGKTPDVLIIEDKGSGISLRQMLAREGIASYPYNPGKADKLARLNSVSHFFAHGIVYFPESETQPGEFKTWTSECIKQLCSYAGEGSIAHDDYCFVAGTPISMADGSEKAIENIQVNDLVLTPQGPAKVKKAFSSGVRATFTININNRSLRGTANHPIYTKRGWIALDQLNPNDICLNQYNEECAVTMLAQLSKISRVYNLTVEGAHCYYANTILVHNCDSTSQALIYLADKNWLSMTILPPEPKLRLYNRHSNPYAA